MAEFVQTMKDWKRMCDTYDHCSDCPLNDDRETCIHAARGKWTNSVDNLERRVMAWAAKHPEPVYPTWFEWLEERRILAAAKSVGTETIFDTLLPTPAMFEPIPADVAEALKIPPKEG